MSLKIKQSLFFVCLFFLFILILLIYNIPLILNNYKLLIGFDSGEYVYELIKYNNGDYINSVTRWQEPGIYIFLNHFKLITGLNTLDLFKFVNIFFILLLMINFIILLNKIKIDKEWIPISILITFLSLISISFYFMSFFRQFFATILFIFIIYLMEEKKFNLTYSVLMGIILGMIFISHRGISLIVFLFIFTSIFFGIIKREKIWKFYLFSIFLAFILSLIYFLPSFLDQISILSDSIRLSLSSLFSYNRIVGGRSLISDSGNINPFVDYLFSQTYIILFGFIGILVYLKNKKAKNIHLIILILFLWIIFSFNFSNRLTANFNFIILLFSPLLFININNKYIKIMSVFFISILLIISSVQLSELKRPYFNSNFGGEEFIDNDIPTNNSLIIAPDYIQTMLMQKGFEPPIRNDILNGIHLLGLQKSDDFLLTGFNNLSLI